jgi:hypothetical protein
MTERIYFIAERKDSKEEKMTMKYFKQLNKKLESAAKEK